MNTKWLNKIDQLTRPTLIAASCSWWTFGFVTKEPYRAFIVDSIALVTFDAKRALENS